MRYWLSSTSPRYTVIVLALLAALQGCASVTGQTSEDYGNRTLGTVWDDQMIESRGKAIVRAASSELHDAHLGITSFNGMVLLTGQVASEETKNAATLAIKDLRKVRTVHNELEIAGPTTMMARTNDAWLTTKVKTVLLTNQETDAGRVKVVTENGVVYLMGLLSRAESEATVEKVRQVFGVQKIVKIFEYIN
ncbi:MAG: BON domain-containing protein [SAR86 cluster bacterium]|jgi:osmotically-inducible protein OsmY|uniref:BON domain-containing protein n=1 Tax=SAR86 cluster bacterium TaxID=2030880 RepID=A0A972VWL5_9GAMM|nr:BON domain-containing protein [SAR86 cluster bacterium]|tara:strand:+ start:22909 stop:23487 length:579 start_codon:yes stop_codon:yes gene_type:complete